MGVGVFMVYTRVRGFGGKGAHLDIAVDDVKLVDGLEASADLQPNLPRTTRVTTHRTKGYLAHTKTSPPRTLQ